VEPYCPLEEGEVLRVLQEEELLQPLTATAEEEKGLLRWREAVRSLCGMQGSYELHLYEDTSVLNGPHRKSDMGTCISIFIFRIQQLDQY